MKRMKTMDAPPRIFDTSVFIGKGKQAALDIAIDETATKGKAGAPAEKVKEMPGQGGFVFGGWINSKPREREE